MERLIAKAYNNVWVAEDGDWRAEIYLEDDGLRVLIDHKLGDNKEDVWEWYDDCYDIRLYQRGAEDEILKATILKGEYDLFSDSVTATGEFDGEEPFTVTFSYDTDYDMIWTENGVDTVLEESFLTD